MIKCFEILNKLFGRLTSKRAEIPKNFDYQLFGKVVLIGLDSDHSVVLVKVLIFLYNNLPLFPKYVVARFVMTLLKEKFIYLFCHWSNIVRNVFHHLLMYRVYYLFSSIESRLFDIL